MLMKQLVLGILVLVPQFAWAGSYSAYCDAREHGSMGWVGPARSTHVEAKRDANAHNGAYKRHHARPIMIPPEKDDLRMSAR
jgi:hypothetical protein